MNGMGRRRLEGAGSGERGGGGGGGGGGRGGGGVPSLELNGELVLSSRVHGWLITLGLEQCMEAFAEKGALAPLP
eukprot:766494-Hanusia_phi.AAC.1